MPTVSVLVPVYNASRYLAASVRGILNQTYADLELIAVDDGSTDDSLLILRRLAATDPRMRVSTGPNRGVVATRNECLRLARGRLLAVNDADDVSVPQRLEHQVAYLHSHPACVAVGSRMKLIDPDGLLVAEAFDLITHEQIDNHNLATAVSAIGHSSVLMRADAVRQVGGYREGFGPAEDFDLWLRLAEVGRLANLPEPLVEYRLHGESLTHVQADRQVQRARLAVMDARVRRGLQPVDFPDEPADHSHAASLPHVGWVLAALRSKNYSTARCLGYKAIRAHPLSPQAWRALTLALVGPGVPLVVACLRRLRGVRHRAR